MAENLTPMMKQFYDLKAKNPDAVLLFRCGDFYETYDADAVTASQVLGITLTRRNNKGQAAATEMAGFPHHALDTYLPRHSSFEYKHKGKALLPIKQYPTNVFIFPT